MPSSKSVKISILATSLILAQLSDGNQIAFLDIEVLRETEKAVLVEFQDKDGIKSGETEWLPKKALAHKKLMGEDVYTVIDWFSEHVDHGQISGYYDKFGYSIEIS